MKKKIKKIYKKIEKLINELEDEYDSVIYCEISYYSNRKGWITFIAEDGGFKSMEKFFEEIK